MKILSQRCWTWFAAAAALAVTGLPAHAESFAVGDKPDNADRIDFTVDLQPWDAFSPTNKVGAPREFSRGEVIRLVVHGAPRKGFHTYPLTQQYKDQAPFISHMTVDKSDDFRPLWPIVETPPPQSVPEKDVGLLLEYRQPFTWVQELYIQRMAKPGVVKLRFAVDLQLCDEQTCKPGTHTFEVPFTIIDGPPVEPRPGLDEQLKVVKAPPVTLIEAPVAPPAPAEAVPPPPVGASSSPAAGPVKLSFQFNFSYTWPPAAPPPAAEPPQPSVAETAPVVQPAAKPSSGGLGDLLGFMWQGVVWGALSLLTPCVFPMIPITVSYFLKHSEKSTKPALAGNVGAASAPVRAAKRGYPPVLLASIYSLTIAVVLTVAGVLLLPLVQQFSQHWATNLVLGGLFIFFALSLFGMYDITLPSWLGRLTAAGEGRGGLLGVVSMALTFTVISFACVAPFYGGFIALTASASTASDWLKLVLGALAFSVTFALPFFVLALFPFLLKALPKSGSWMNTVKVVMGFLELAAAFKFLRSAELNYFVKTDFLTYDIVLGIYVALAVACGLYLLGVYRLPHDHGGPETLTVPRLLFSIAFLGLALYMLPGLFKTADGEQQRPQGTVFAWLDSFLVPQETPPSTAAAQLAKSGGAPPAPSGKLVWLGDLKQALKQAEVEKKPVFIDFTATTCTNCIYNDRSVFTKPEVKNQLRQYVLVHLYTDNVPEGYESSKTGKQNETLEHTVFSNAQLPLYAIVKPTGAGSEIVDRYDGSGFEIVGTYGEGAIHRVSDFTQFLQDKLPKPPSDARAEVKGE